jgi:serine phosphatase RsbU (regulator of sigma subunit)/anti-sigma regulatory factor (Ser/Thr protein kinase)
VAGADQRLLVELARVVHGPAAVDDKVAWVVAALRNEAGASTAVFVEGAAPGGSADLLVPVVGATGTVYGKLAVTGADPTQHPLVIVMAAHLGAAFDHMRQLDELRASQREVVHRLQEAVRPLRPDVPGAELGVYYLAADPRSATGGDLHDWQVLPDGGLHLAVVDVMGKGLEATKDALTVTHALRFLSLEGVPMERLMERADEILSAHDPELVATAVVARFDPATGRLRLAGAGHPPAMLLSPSSPGPELIEAPGVPIGWPGAGSEKVIELTLGRSDTVVLYTDGLIEAGKDIISGMESLVRAGREVADYPAEHLARALVDRALAGGDRRDDTLALVVRRRVAPGTVPRISLAPFEHRFSANTAAVVLARHLLADWLAHQPVDSEATDDILLIANELCTNAVTAAPDGTVVLRAALEEDAVEVEVQDEGGVAPPFPTDYDQGPPDAMAESGRGLYLVKALSDEVSVEVQEGRTSVRCVKRAVATSR